MSIDTQDDYRTAVEACYLAAARALKWADTWATLARRASERSQEARGRVESCLDAAYKLRWKGA